RMANDWSDEELRAAVDIYVEMLRKHRFKESFIKKHYYAELHAKYGRTEKSFEYRMQNISYVLSLMGRNWLPGLKPAKNVGAKNAAKIEAMLAQAEKISLIPVAAFETMVREEIGKPSLEKPVGNTAPKAIQSEISTYQRDARVKGWVLKEANGICEGCGQPAPFYGADGIPYLEVHHIRQLAEGGSDTIMNVVALCPNCHREMHYGIDREFSVGKLYARVGRLIRE
ncbi:HNH endonuclease, partial [Desulfovibrio sp. OttesenSCG-928-M14]|nr:HNH endonuclease [Desulfovibrio sp. OttesenSCG-928-M14]